MKKSSDKKLSTASTLRKPLFAALLLAGAVHVGVAQAATLPTGAVLNITPGSIGTTGYVSGGSYFGMDQNGNFAIAPGEKTAINLGTMSTSASCVTGVISIGTGIPIGSPISASGSHGNCIDGTESPAFDKWEFFGNTGMDYIRVNATNPAQAVVTDNGNGTLVFSGWTVTWNGIAAIPMNANAWQPTAGNCAVLGCTGWTFTNGNARFQWTHATPLVWSSPGTYILDYTATVPVGDPSGFGGVKYYLHLIGTVTLPAFTLSDDSAATKTNIAKTISVTANDNPVGYTIPSSNAVAIASTPSNGTAVANADNTVTYTPTGGFNGTDSFTYTVTDSNGITSSPATVTVTVNAVLPPTATDDSNNTTNGTSPDPIAVLNNDTGGDFAIDPTSVTVSTAASHGATSVNGTTGVVTYTANSGFSGTDTFQYTVKDTAGNISNAATVTIAVRAVVPSSSSGSFAPGTTATAAGGTPATTGGGLTTSEVGTDSALTQQCVGGCFDFIVSGLTNGGSVKVVLPLSTAIPANAVYRKLVNGTWQDFSSGGGNAIASAASVSAGVCPEAGSASYSSGLTAGNNCVQLTLVDGGADDDNGSAGVVGDPSGVGVKGTNTTLAAASTSGCSLSSSRVSLNDRGDWLLLLGFITWLGMVIRRRQHRA